MRNFIKSLQNRLVNVNKNNKSLLHLRLQKNNEVDLSDFLYAGFIKNPHSILVDLVDGRKVITLLQDVDTKDDTANILSSRLKKIDLTTRTIFEEKGCLDLFVGWPYIEGKLQNDIYIHCPLLYIPIKLFKESGCWKISQNTGLQISFNRSFLIAYSHYNQISLSKDFIETDFSMFSSDLGLFKNQLYEFLKLSPLEIDFNRDLFSDSLQLFRAKSKNDLEQAFKFGQLKLSHQALLGVFPQFSSYLFPDYDKFLECKEFESIEDFFYVKEKATISGATLQENRQYLPFSIDGSQEFAFDKIKKGSSLVVQGPPGSGKSQLICNLISDFVARGKKVLVVSQKKVALEVVRNRLQEVGLSAFSSLVHDSKADRASVYNQLASQISCLPDFELSNNNLNTIFLEREFLQASKQLELNRNILEEYKKALFDSTCFGISAKELYLNSTFDETFFQTSFAEKFTLDSASVFLQEFSSRFSWFLNFESNPDFVLKNRRSLHLLQPMDLSLYILILTELFDFKLKLSDSFKSLGVSKIDYNEIERIYNQVDKFNTNLEKLRNPLTRNISRIWISEDKQSIRKIKFIQKELIALFVKSKFGVEDLLSSEERKELFLDLQLWENAKPSFFKSNFWRFSKKHTELKKILAYKQLKWSNESFEFIYCQLKNRFKFEELQKELHFLGFDLQEKSCIEFFEEWSNSWLVSQELVSYFKKETCFFSFIQGYIHDFDFLEQEFVSFHTLIREFKQKASHSLFYLSIDQIQDLVNNWDKTFLDEVILAASCNFEELLVWDRYWNSVESFKKLFCAEIFSEQVLKSFEEFKTRFIQILYGNWLLELESISPILTLASSERLQVVVSDFQHAIQRKLNLSKDILLLRVKEKTYATIEFNRLQNRVTYRELEHQVTKKKRLWPMNKIMENFSSEVFDLIPCWLCSPESASALFPAEEIFDLVIFDEASQCYLERGFPGLLRGKQVVVCGDSKQLQPTDLYSIRWEEEQEYENSDLEIDSLLAFSEKYLETVMLKGHYRSKSADLIAFSNQYFYDSKLLCIPNKAFLQQNPSVLEYKKVPGYWDKNSNSVEAKEVVELIKSLDFKAKKIGVITFNYIQQELIQDLLSEYFSKNEMMFPKTIFVKNIENVQGDEADIIIFSIGYAPTLNGKFTMNFGLLNQEGGENRLNVAVTRAREKIIVVTSIYPNQLEVDSSLHEGPKCLKKYLEFVYEFSKTGNQTKFHSEIDKQHRHRYLKDRVLEILNSDNQHTTSGLHFGDLATIDNSKNLDKIILTDDQLYYEDSSVKSIYAYLPNQLLQKGWDFKRFYSRNLWKDKNTFHKVLSDFVKR